MITINITREGRGEARSVCYHERFFKYFIKLKTPTKNQLVNIINSTICIPFFWINYSPVKITYVGIPVLFNQSYNISGVIVWRLDHLVSDMGLDPHDPNSTSVRLYIYK